MPILEWIGKDKVVNHHQEVPYRVLERQYSYDEAGQHAEDNGSENMIIHGDNLQALKALLPQYEGKVKCIYIDPPYNTGNEGWVYNDNVNDPKIKKWLGEVVGREAYSSNFLLVTVLRSYTTTTPGAMVKVLEPSFHCSRAAATILPPPQRIK